MTVVNITRRAVTFVKYGKEITLTWGELNFLKRHKSLYAGEDSNQ